MLGMPGGPSGCDGPDGGPECMCPIPINGGPPTNPPGAGP